MSKWQVTSRPHAIWLRGRDAGSLCCNLGLVDFQNSKVSEDMYSPALVAFDPASRLHSGLHPLWIPLTGDTITVAIEIVGSKLRSPGILVESLRLTLRVEGIAIDVAGLGHAPVIQYLVLVANRVPIVPLKFLRFMGHPSVGVVL